MPAALGATAQPVLDRSRADPRLGSLGRAAVDRLPGGWSVWRAPHNPSTSELLLACKRFVLGPELIFTGIQPFDPALEASLIARASQRLVA